MYQLYLWLEILLFLAESLLAVDFIFLQPYILRDLRSGHAFQPVLLALQEHHFPLQLPKYMSTLLMRSSFTCFRISEQASENLLNWAARQSCPPVSTRSWMVAMLRFSISSMSAMDRLHLFSRLILRMRSWGSGCSLLAMSSASWRAFLGGSVLAGLSVNSLRTILTALLRLFMLIQITPSVMLKYTTHWYNSQLVMSKQETEREQQDSEGEDEDVEREVVGNWKIVDLPVIQVLTGEEGEDRLAVFRCRMFRHRDGEWKERGIGELRFLKDRASGKVRVLMRADKTHRILVNFNVNRKDGNCELQKSLMHEDTWVWKARDFSDRVLFIETFSAKFNCSSDALKFEQQFISAAQTNENLLPKQPSQK